MRLRGGLSTVPVSPWPRPSRPLAGLAVTPTAHGVATEYACRVLQLLGAETQSAGGWAIGDGVAHTTVQDWADSGAMWLTGRPDGPPLVPAGAPASALRGALAALALVARVASTDVPRLPGVELLGERAAIAGLVRQGPTSAGGAFRIGPTAEGWVGLNLARPSDVELILALTCGALEGSADVSADHLWEWLAGQSASQLAERGRLLGLPLVQVRDPRQAADEQLRARWGQEDPEPLSLHPGGLRPSSGARPVVVDLSSLWAGPLTAHLMGLVGARVIKVESRRRPDGARRGPAGFFDLMHAGHESVALDLPDPWAVELLHGLVAKADLVIDASRPRAMRQLGIDVDQVVAAGTSWVSITGYGRTGPWADQPAFGDDAAAAGGLVAHDRFGPMPAGDAIADPLAGVHAAVAGLAALTDDRAWLVDVALREVAAVAAALTNDGQDDHVVVARPRARPPAGPGRSLGADTATVLAELKLTA